ncbi:conserved membrane hypothetical protein [Crenothrix polyspora]|uniref:Uncharacterized protein n=1 Tax=Crenothrix polyspora TaxID=360316 RepID=A0A1R4GZK3_9GAMM|nr:hypothetical protein [Crenothrix polyspora]SJM89401.1 conserved membrane hypothetical protein [Crenothrix polyspora]
MSNRISPQHNKSDLNPHWLVVAVMLILLATYIIACENMVDALPNPLPETQRIWIRTLCYGIAILMFPLTNLIRHIQLRLNQTMPGTKPAKNRYLLTIMVSMLLIQGIGVLGVVMFVLGDDFNTLYILVGMAALAVFLYRPKWNEYISVVEALEAQRHPSLR